MLNLRFRSAIKTLGVGLTAWLLSIFLYSPRLTLFLGYDSDITRRDNLLKQCLDPFRRDLVGLESTSLYSRLVQPTIANFLGWCGDRRDFLAILGSPGIAYIALILTLSFTYLALKKKLSDKVALPTTFLISTTMVTQWTNTFWGHPDSLTFLPISIVLYIRKWWVIMIATFIGCLNDERFVLAIPFILLWWWPKEYKNLKVIFQKLMPIIFPLLIGLFIYVITRIFLSIGLIGPGIEDASEFFKVLLIDHFLTKILNPSAWPSIFLTVFLSYRWVWIIVVLSILISMNNGYSLKFFFFIFSIIGTIFLSNVNADISRSISFAFPLIPYSLLLIYDNYGDHDKRITKIINMFLFLNVLTPAAVVYVVPSDWLTTNPLEWANPALPLPINLWRWFTAPNGSITW